jgi:hypothetical protein
LQLSKLYIGTTLNSKTAKNGKYLPEDLHFPSVGIELEWLTLLIIDWPDIDPCSDEYAFLKEIGVRQVPDLHKLIDRIVEEHNDEQRRQPNTTPAEYKIPVALRFLVTNFLQHYSRFRDKYKIENPFLPSYYSAKLFDKNGNKKNTEIVLLTPDNVFKGLFLFNCNSFITEYYSCLSLDESPMCATLLPEVTKLLTSHFDVSLIGVKQRPTLTIAFDNLMKKRDEILTAKSAPTLFAYLNGLDGLTKVFIESISKLAFIPLQGSFIFE